MSVLPPSSATDRERRFAGVARLYGQAGAARIRQAHLVVVGIGGVGSWAAEALARSGIGTLTLIDLDNVAESNINRQLHALDVTIGQPKVEAMTRRIHAYHPDCRVHAVEDFLDEDNVAALLGARPIDGVLDCCDQVRAKVACAVHARAHALPLITVGAAGGRMMAHQVEIDDLGRLTHDPLLAQVRYRLRRHHRFPPAGKAMRVPCVFSREPIQRAASDCGIQQDSSLNCAGYGSSVAVTATFGMAAAGWMLKKIAGTANT